MNNKRSSFKGFSSFPKHLLNKLADSLNRLKVFFSGLSLGQKIVFTGGAILLSISAVTALGFFVANSTTVVPDYGGRITEGVTGYPRFINPLLATSDVDRDLTTLTYAGLLKHSENGTLVPELAEALSSSADMRSYTVILKDGITFHDGTPLTAQDVAFTIEMAKNPVVRSPARANWEGVTVEVVDSKTLIFRLSQDYPSFVSKLTLGILPRHIWASIPVEEFAFSDQNLTPVGAGPYRVTSTTKGADGYVNEYRLRSFKNYTLGEPYISHYSVKLYPTDTDRMQALATGTISSAARITPSLTSLVPNRLTIDTAILSRQFALFFNQSQNPILQDITIRRVLTETIDRDHIINEVLEGYGIPLYHPIFDIDSVATSTEHTILSAREAVEILTENGWNLNEREGTMYTTFRGEEIPLSIELITVDVPELVQVATEIQERWQQFGAKVNLIVERPEVLTETRIRPRTYEVLLFGIVVGPDEDLFGYFHSSQRNDPGLNISMYANSQVDALLETLRVTEEEGKRKSLQEEFILVFNEDLPASFLYAPKHIHAVPTTIKGKSHTILTDASDRFRDIEDWYIHTKRIIKNN